MSVADDVRRLEEVWDHQKSGIRKKALIRNLCSRYGRSHPQQLPQLRQALRCSKVYADYVQVLGGDHNWVEKSY